MAPTPSKLPVVTAFGGGHGLAVSLRALRRLTDQLTAVVTVADNGGSSGRLRDEFDILPPGDLRRALAALCADDRLGRTWALVLTPIGLMRSTPSLGKLPSRRLGQRSLRWG